MSRIPAILERPAPVTRRRSPEVVDRSGSASRRIPGTPGDIDDLFMAREGCGTAVFGLVVVGMLFNGLLRACGLSPDTPAAPSPATSIDASSKSVETSRSNVAMPPTLGSPGENVGKMKYRYITVGCLKYVIYPVSQKGDPIREINIENTCDTTPKGMATRQAKALIPAGVPTCYGEWPERVAGASVSVRLEQEHYPCVFGEQRILRHAHPSNKPSPRH